MHKRGGHDHNERDSGLRLLYPQSYHIMEVAIIDILCRAMSGNKILASNDKVTVLSNPLVSPSASSALIIGNNDHTDGADLLNLNLEGFEDKNPFSGFSEEHLSKLDEFLSSEEAKKILKETSEDDFSPAMAELEDTDVGELGHETAHVGGGDSLLFTAEPQTAGNSFANTFSDHAYAMPVDKAPKSAITQTVKPHVITVAQVKSVSSPVTIVHPTAVATPVTAVPITLATTTTPVTAIPITLATASPSGSPRKSSRIALRKGAKEDDPKVEEVKQEEQEAMEEEDSGKSDTPLKGKAKAKKTPAVEEKHSPVPSRRSTRIGDIEQRELAEKIRQENIQKEKEAMEAMKKESEEEDSEKKNKKKTPKKKGKASQTAEEEGSGEEEEEEEGEKEEETKKTPKQRGRPPKGKASQTAEDKGSKEQEEAKEKEEEVKEEETKKTLKQKGRPPKGKASQTTEEKGSVEMEVEEEQEQEQEEETKKTPKQRGRPPKGKASQTTEEEGDGEVEVEEEQEKEQEQEEETKKTPKQRGRPPKGKASQTTEEEGSGEVEVEEKEEQEPEQEEETTKTPKQSGRPPKGKASQTTEEEGSLEEKVEEEETKKIPKPRDMHLKGKASQTTKDEDRREEEVEEDEEEEEKEEKGKKTKKTPKLRGRPPKSKASQTPEDESSGEDEEEGEEETKKTPPKQRGRPPKDKGKKTKVGRKKKEVENEEAEEENDDEESEEEVDDEEEEQDKQPQKSKKKVLKKGAKGKLKGKGIKRKAQEEKEEEVAPKKAKTKKGKGKEEDSPKKKKKLKMKGKQKGKKEASEEESDDEEIPTKKGKAKKVKEESDEEMEEEETPKKKGKGKVKKEDSDEEMEQEETPKKKGKGKAKKKDSDEEMEQEETPKKKGKGKKKKDESDEEIQEEETPKKKGKGKGKNEEKLTESSKKKGKGKLKKDKKEEAENEEEEEVTVKGKKKKKMEDDQSQDEEGSTPKGKKKKKGASAEESPPKIGLQKKGKGKVEETIGSPKKRKITKEVKEEDEDETPKKKKKKVVNEEADVKEDKKTKKVKAETLVVNKKKENVASPTFKKKKKVAKADTDDGTPNEGETTKDTKKKAGEKHLAKSESEDDAPLSKLGSEGKTGKDGIKKVSKGTQGDGDSDSETLNKKAGKISEKGKFPKKKVTRKVLADETLQEDKKLIEIKREKELQKIIEVKRESRKLIEVKGEKVVRGDKDTSDTVKDKKEKGVIKTEQSEKIDDGEKKEKRVRRDSEKKDKHVRRESKDHKCEKELDETVKHSKDHEHKHFVKRRDSKESVHSHDGSHHHHRYRHDSKASDQSQESKRRDSKEYSKMPDGEQFEDADNAEHKPARRKSRKSEEIVLDPTVTDLFKPDDIVFHHEGEPDKRERSARKKRKTFGQDFEEGDVSEIEEVEDVLPFEDDENDSDWDPPDVLYCICKQPHNNRFMIGCDKCENWYHGTCVGISRARGREMEKNNEEYTCPVCAEKEHKASGEVKKEISKTPNKEMKQEPGKGDKSKPVKEDKDKKSSKGDIQSIFDKFKTEKSEKTSVDSKTKSDRDQHANDAKLKTPVKDDISSDKIKTSLSKEKMRIPHKDEKSKTPGKMDKDGKPLLGSIHVSQTTPDDKKKRFKSLKEKHTAMPCIASGCKHHALIGSVYCSPECLNKHTKDCLKVIHKQQEKQVQKSPKGSISEKKIVVWEKKSGQIITGPTAPTESNLMSWLEEHPTFEVLCPKPSLLTSNHDKDRDSSSKDKDKHSSSRDKHKHKDHHSRDRSKEKVKEEEVKKEKKEEGPDPVRLNVRRSLRDALARRSEDADDVMLSSGEMKKIALSIEEELFKLFKETGHKYKSRYRSLIFNIKDTKNKGLFRKILKRNIKHSDLVRMNPEELASKELAKWREDETKHTLQMIETTEKEHMKEHLHITKKTHKGEVELEEEDLSTLENKNKPSIKPLLSPPIEHNPDILTEFIADTTDQHKKHLFDLNCKICTGKVAPPVDETPLKKGAVTKMDTKMSKEVKFEDKKSEEKKSEEDRVKAEEVVKEVLKAIKKAKEEQQAMASADSTVTVRSPDSALQSGLEKKTKFTPQGPQLWKGFVFMQDVAKFVTTAYRVSGPAEKLDLPDTIHICGRIAPELVFDYVEKMKKIGSKEICVLRFIPGSAEEKAAYINMYSYLNSRSRCGVVGNHAKHIKDFYILPLASHSKIPSVIKPFDGPGLEENRPHMLLAIVVKQKVKRHPSDKSETASTSTHSKHEPYKPADVKKPKVATKEKRLSSASSTSSVSSSSSFGKSQTPPITKGSDKHPRPPSFYNPISTKHSHSHSHTHSSKKDKDRGKEKEKRLSPSSMLCATNISSSDAQFPPEPVPEDPIVQVYGEQDEDAAAGSSPYSPSKEAEKETNEAPYDPEDDEQYAGSKLKQKKPAGASAPVTPAAPKGSRTLSITETIDHIARSSNPAQATAMMVAALASATNVKDKQRLLKELTDKVEMKKKMLQKSKEGLAGTSKISEAPVVATTSAKVLSSSVTESDSKVVSSAGSNVSVTSTNVSSEGAVASTTTKAVSSAVKTSTSAVKTVTSAVKTVMSASAVTSVASPGTKKSKTVSAEMAETNKALSTTPKSDTSDTSLPPGNEGKTESLSAEQKLSRDASESAKNKTDIDKKKDLIEKSSSESNSQKVEESNEPRKVLSPDSLPCALKSLLSSIPGNYSHFSNVRDTSQKEDTEERPKVDKAELIPFVEDPLEKKEIPEGVRVEIKTVEEKPKVKKKKEKSKERGKGFNLSLLAFDYGESDSENEGKTSEDVESESDSESENENVPKPLEVKEEKVIAPLPKGVFGALAPPPLPEEDHAPPPEEPPMPPPLPPEEPPPPPDMPEDKEKKSKKPKPPPEIMLKPIDPVGRAILEATYKKIQRDMTVPAPPMPPPQIMPSAPVMPPVPQAPPIPQPGILPIPVSTMPQSSMSPVGMSASLGEQGLSLLGPAPMSHMAQSTMPSMQQSGVPRVPKGGMPPMARRNMPQNGRSPQGMPAERPSNGRGKRWKKGGRGKNIPSLFDVEVKPSKRFGYGEDLGHDEFPSLDQDLRQAKDLDLRKMDVDERQKAWQNALNPQFQTSWPEDVDHRQSDIDHRRPLNPAMPESLQEETSLPPLPMDLHVQDSDFRQYSALQEDSDLRKVTHKRETHKLAGNFEEHLDVDLRMQPSASKHLDEQQSGSPNQNLQEKGPTADDLPSRSLTSSLLPAHIMSAPDIAEVGSPNKDKSPEISVENLKTDTDSRKKDVDLKPPPALPLAMAVPDIPAAVPPRRVPGPRMPPPVSEIPQPLPPSRGPPPAPRLPSRPQPAPPGVDDWD